MIVVELNVLLKGKIFDIQVDEHLTVKDILEELAGYIEFNVSETYLASIEGRSILNNAVSISNQGVRSGDTLLLIENNVS